MNVIILNSIWASTVSRSLGPYLLRHCLNKRGYTCQVIDHCQEFSYEDIQELLLHFVTEETICLGFSTTFWHDSHGVKRKDDQGSPPEVFIRIMNWFKEKWPNKKIVLGGAGARYITKNIQNVDAIILGDSEDLFPEVLDYWRNIGSEPHHTFWYDSNLPVYNAPLTKSYDISTCDFEWQDCDAILPGEVLPIEVARGCIFKCAFCGYPHLGKKKLDFLRNTSQIRNQFIRNYQKWGITHYIIVDDTFNDSEQKVDDFLNISKSLPFELKFWAYIRADLLHHYQGQAHKLKEAGLQACTIGIETINKLASMNIGKGWNGKHAREWIPKLVHEIWQDDVNVMISLIVGLPGENRESIVKTADWVDENKLSAVFNPLYVVSDEKKHVAAFLSEFEKNSDKFGIVKTGNGNWSSQNWTSDEARKFAYELNKNRKTKRLHSMLHVYARTYNFTHQELINADLDTQEFASRPAVKNRIASYINNYKIKLLSTKT